VGKIKIAPLTKESIRKATEKGKEIANAPSAIVSAKLERIDGNNTLRLAFRNGEVLAIPVRHVAELKGATQSQLKRIEISPLRDSIGFPDADAQIYVPGLLADVLSPLIQPEISRRAGRKSTPKKAAAVRENGKKGGRPKKRATGRP